MMQKFMSDHHLSDLVVDHSHQKFIRLLVGETVAEGLRRIQSSPMEGRIVYFYVVDEHDRLEGVIPTRRLLLNPPETRVADIMERQVVAIPATATLLDACEFFVLHRLLALPVIDQDRRIVGVLDVELYTNEISDLVQREESEDLFQIIGVRLAQVRQASILAAFMRRFPWLLCNIGGGLACAGLAAAFERVLEETVVLAMFIPIVLALAESVSVQSLTLAIQIHDPSESNRAKVFRRLRREALIGILLGLACGAIVGVSALVWHSALAVLLVIGGSIALSVATAAMIGLSIPVALRAVERDPKIASGPIALATTDIFTLFYYLGLATLVFG